MDSLDDTVRPCLKLKPKQKRRPLLPLLPMASSRHSPAHLHQGSRLPLSPPFSAAGADAGLDHQDSSVKALR